MKRKALEVFLEEIRDRLGDKVKEIIVFGSYARGDYDEESDIDIMIVGDVSLGEVIDISTEVLLRYGELISPIVVTPEEFKKRNDSFTSARRPLPKGRGGIVKTLYTIFAFLLTCRLRRALPLRYPKRLISVSFLLFVILLTLTNP